MFKTKYYYDKNSLSYRKVEVNKSTQIRNILAFLISSMFFGIMVLLILLKSTLVNTPTELTQAREISNFKLQFNLLNKKIDQLNLVLEDIEQRDFKDSSRELSPLLPADDAHIIDSSEMSLEDVIRFTKNLVKEEYI